jgi:hypothetical protein
MKKNHRLSIFIFPWIQIPLICVALITGTAIIAFGAKVVRNTFAILKNDALDAGLPSGHPFFQLLENHLDTIILNLAAIGLISGAVSAIVLFIYSHRFLGPIFAMKKYFGDFQNGRRLIFRRGDYFKDLADDVNKSLGNGN